jgi:hypothetical protein
MGSASGRVKFGNGSCTNDSAAGHKGKTARTHTVDNRGGGNKANVTECTVEGKSQKHMEGTMMSCQMIALFVIV